MTHVVLALAVAACSAPENRQFDFWLGRWRVTTPGGKLAGTNVVTREYGGCVLQEHWSGTGGSRGSSFNVYDPARKLWHQTWVDNGGTLLLLDGGFRAGAMTLTGRTPTAKGTRIDRIVWTKRPDGAVRQLWRTSSDGGATWQVAFDGLYRRMP